MTDSDSSNSDDKQKYGTPELESPGSSTPRQKEDESDESFLARVTLVVGENLRTARHREVNDVLDRYFCGNMKEDQNRRDEMQSTSDQHMAVKHANRKEVNTCILSNSNFEDWFKLIRIELGREGIKELLLPSDDETKFLEIDADDRMVKMKDYDHKQDVGLSVIFDRMPSNLRGRVRECCTVRTVIEKLKKEMRVTTAIGKMGARDAWTDLRYRQGDNLINFLTLHEAKLAEYVEAGGVVSDEDKVYQLYKSMPKVLDPAFTEYNCSGEAKSYDLYRKLVLDVYKRLQLDKNSNNEKRDDSRRSGRNAQQNNNFSRSSDPNKNNGNNLRRNN